MSVVRISARYFPTHGNFSLLYFNFPSDVSSADAQRLRNCHLDRIDFYQHVPLNVSHPRRPTLPNLMPVRKIIAHVFTKYPLNIYEITRIFARE